MYHICESLDIVIYLPQLKWHELDNIGAICCLNSLLINKVSNKAINIKESKVKKV